MKFMPQINMPIPNINIFARDFGTLCGTMEMIMEKCLILEILEAKTLQKQKEKERDREDFRELNAMKRT